MHLTFINGIPNEEYEEYETALKEIKTELEKEHEVVFFTARNMNINYCCGCFSCWTKTPGLCIFKDDMRLILKSMANTDCIIYVSPLSAGFVTSVTKKVMDRFIPNALPYIKIYDGECHHPSRYDNSIKLGVVILDEGNLDSEAVEITKNMFERLSKNMHATKFFHAVAKAEEMEVVLNEISSC
ncbi:MAG: flavodoxin family protein [Clostridiaceae bacterium]|nr:flavodoxin family protein [Clostridiaceae bacterium]